MKMKTMNIVICLYFILFTVAGVPAWGFDGMDIPKLKQMAEEGNADAQSKLGVMYASGVGIEMNKQEAVKWYQKSAEQDYPIGLWNLAFMYVRGEGVEVNYNKARELFQKSADSGFANAQYDLGMMYLQGLGGKEDRVEAENCFNMAAEQGYREAKKILKEFEPK